MNCLFHLFLGFGFLKYGNRKLCESIFVTVDNCAVHENIWHNCLYGFSIGFFKYGHTLHNFYCSIADNDVAVSTTYTNPQFTSSCNSLHTIHGGSVFRHSLLWFKNEDIEMLWLLEWQDTQKFLFCSGM